MPKAPRAVQKRHLQWSSLAVNRLMNDLMTTPGMKMTKMDRRHTGWLWYNWQIHLTVDQFIQVRNWCWETFGPSFELDLVKSDRNPVWCWRSAGYHAIYLRGDEEATLFKLKWA